MILSDEAPFQADLLNCQYDSPKIVLGNFPNRIEELTPPFYITLELQDLHLRNCLYDSEASYSLINLMVMEKLWLDITRIYTNIYAFDHKKEQRLGYDQAFGCGNGANSQ
jgi:hypothetical protein